MENTHRNKRKLAKMVDARNANTKKPSKQRIQDDERNIRRNLAEFWKYVKSDGESSSYPIEMFYTEESRDITSEIVDLFANYF